MIYMIHRFNDKGRCQGTQKKSAAALSDLFSTHKQLVKISQAGFKPGGSSMIALICAFSDFHFAQQSIHFSD